MDLREIGQGDTDWTDVAQNTDQWRDLVNTIMIHWVSYNGGLELQSDCWLLNKDSAALSDLVSCLVS
jgi:hypothetical protein